MNLFSKILFTLIFSMLAFEQAWSISVRSIYTAACQRETGVIVHADPYNIKVLNLRGKVVTIPRYKIIYLADYPIDQFPSLSKRLDLNKIDQIHVKTKVGRDLKTLVKGWPIGFTKDKISFLTPRGRETIVKRNSIWSIESIKLARPINFRVRKQNIEFAPPYAFVNCPKKSRKAKTLKIYPQQVLSDAIVIKRSLDEYAEGLKQVAAYKKEQRFYPVPIIHPSYNSLGLWHSIGSRHGSSGKRPSNFTPVLKNSYSSDVFDYQHIFVTGSAPMLFSVHDEPQTRSYYGFKDSYFHLAAMLDPTTILVGENYAWKAADLDDNNAQMADTFYFEMGLDFGFFSFYGASHSLNVGIAAPGGNFEEENVGLGGLGIVLQNHNYRFEVWTKTGEHNEQEYDTADTETKVNVVRLNFGWKASPNLGLTLSAIRHTVEHKSAAFEYSGKSFIGMAMGEYEFNHKYSLGGIVSFESVKADYGSSGSESYSYPKLGINATLKF